MKLRTDLLEKKFKIDGVIYTVYAVSGPGVFAHIGDEKVIDSNGDVVDPKWFSIEEVEQNILDDSCLEKDVINIDQIRIDRLIKHLNNQHELLESLFDSHVKDLVQAEINGIELSLTLLGIKVPSNK